MDLSDNQVLNHLASMPGLAHASITRSQLKRILLDTGGQMLLVGRLYEIVSRHLGAGIYRVSTKQSTP